MTVSPPARLHYSSVRGVNDFTAALVGVPKAKADPTLQMMLMPSDGPTAADKEYEEV